MILLKKGSTIIYDNPIYIQNSFSQVGKLEGEGPMGKYFDVVCNDALFGAQSWEEAENRLVKTTISGLLTKCSLASNDIDFVFAGDLLNQCVGSSFGIKDFDIPFYGLYGACSTFVEGVSLGATYINSGFGKKIIAIASSHFCSSEKQYRFPLEYGGVRTPTSQWTVTGSGGVVLTDESSNVKITSATVGKMVDMGVTDANNMGAAMAGAAADTIYNHFNDMNIDINYYDCIVTGDLGSVGTKLLRELLINKGMDIANFHKDTGMMIFDSALQGTKAGGSGCGCVASVFSSYFMSKLIKGEYKKIFVVGTGALMSPTTVQLGKPIVGIAHGVAFEGR